MPLAPKGRRIKILLDAKNICKMEQSDLVNWQG